ncbi:unnamed protein product [Leptidea sinapis]|uniref:Rab-GAP TBC domain-containing protein n=1 Tax=Leptidea sinapis TaxID=189913 RepID=A0A5E4PS84_9NEOP|nr:unnamed protein product [Leptidea sinapis]
MPAATDPSAEQKERLIAAVKKEVKQLMEEAVTRKFVYEEGGGVTALCGAVEACLGQGLRRRALGLFKTSSTTALLHKIAKNCPEAALISARVLAAEGAPATRSASGVERRPSAPRPPLNKRGSGSLLSQPAPQAKYLWIRLALFERQLAKIIEHLVNNATKYYERDALVADPDYGSILSSLLVGPCALEYSKAKAPTCFWTDPPADELKDVEEPMPGYLSLHQTASGLVIKWTPNQLMNGYAESEGVDKSVYWAMSLQVCVWEVVYVHVHRSQASDALILVGQDGVQRPPQVFGRNKGRRRPMPSLCESGETEEHEFEDVAAMRHTLLERVVQSPPRTPRRTLASTSTTSSDSSTITMRRQIISRAFYGWLAYCRHLSTVRTHLSGLVNPNIIPEDGAEEGLTEDMWRSLMDESGVIKNKNELFESTAEERQEQDVSYRRQYETTMSEWLCVEAIVRQRDREATAASIARLSESSGKAKIETNDTSDVFEDDCSVISDNPPVVSPEPSDNEPTQKKIDVKPILSRAPSIEEIDNMEMDEDKVKDVKQNGETDICDLDLNYDDDDGDDEVCIKSVVENPDLRRESIAEIKRLAEGIVQKGEGRALLCSVDSANVNINGNSTRSDEGQQTSNQHNTHSVIVTNPSVDLAVSGSPASGGTTAPASPARSPLGVVREESHSAGASIDTLDPESRPDNRSNCVSPTSSNGGVYSNELVESFALNLHRIEKDVQRCDRNYPFFTDENLDKLRNIMCTYVWEHLETGYMQGMCDLVAPLLVITKDEAVAHALFTQIMHRAKDNFPSGQAMDAHFADMRYSPHGN